MNTLPWRLILCFVVAGCSSTDDSITVAVASNFYGAAKEVAAKFSAESGIAVHLSSGSTGSLYARIVNGAPYDIFLAADIEHAEKLVAQNFAHSDSLHTYANGQLVLWSPMVERSPRDCLQEMREGHFSRVAMANPRVAPYGRAALQFLQANGLWAVVSTDIVYGESAAQAFQFVATGNADIGLVAASHMISADVENSCVGGTDSVSQDILIPQAGVVLRSTAKEATARRFMRFLRSSTARNLLETHGYVAVAPSVSES